MENTTHRSFGVCRLISSSHAPKNREHQTESTHVHPVALSSHGGDGPVQAPLHLPLQKRVSAVQRHHILHPN